MKVVRTGDSPETLATAPIFLGTVHLRPLIDAVTSPEITVTLVRFTGGGKNRPHTHTADQILYVTEGEGIVASTEQENRVSAGDIVHVPAGEIHWHGAIPGGNMAHLSIIHPCETNVVE
ncbi:MAG: cupin domain-containing protein [Chloroflexi bacterium]|nr:cupin domain-containing protein [Chloroflexota bacterium]